MLTVWDGVPEASAAVMTMVWVPGGVPLFLVDDDDGDEELQAAS